jgi:tRNA A37 threonylcarbamoyladenosine synthetase subunit TsaC/SUA5/YrdC
VAVVLDAGRVGGGVPSTVVQVEGENARILREGALTREQIEQAGRARSPAW